MKFFLKTKKTEGVAPLFFEVNKRTPKFKAQFSTNVHVDIQEWERANESAKNLQRYMSTPAGSDVWGKLHQIENAVDNLFASHAIKSTEDKYLITDAVSDIAFRDERLRIKEQAEEERREKERKDEEKKNEFNDIFKFYTWFVNGIENGTIFQSNGKPYKHKTIVQWRSFGCLLESFLNTRHERTFDDITPQFSESFSLFLLGRGYLRSSISQHVSTFRALCRVSAKYGYNKNAVSLRTWSAPQAGREEKKCSVYLTDEELDALYKMPLEGRACIVRDVFFVGSLISQRYSDYSRIEKSMFRTVDGVLFLNLTQNKTENDVVIPITSERVFMTLQKYDFTFPQFDLTAFNEILLEVFEELAKSVPSLMQLCETVLTKKEKDSGLKGDSNGKVFKYKYQLVTSHTARRTGVTNMYKSGKLDKREMMSITGHTTEKVFECYIKLGAMEQAKRIAEKLQAMHFAENLKTNNTDKGKRATLKNA